MAHRIKTGSKTSESGKGRGGKMGWILTGVVCILFLVLLLAFQLMNTDLEAIADQYRDSWLAIPVLLGVYLLKACTLVVIPQPLVYLLTGLLFSPVPAFLLTLGFLSIEFSLDYFLGKTFGKKLLERILRWLKGKNRFLDRVLQENRLDHFWSIALLRLMPGVSTDSISLLSGAYEIQFRRFFLASMVGCAPQAITVTLLGSSATDPLSPQFLIPLGVLIVVIVASVLIGKKVMNKKSKQKEDVRTDG